ncbi:hypothetical protein [uncultured Rikenella sp.]|uniref:hypothetical protein n=1 Tax=uncultured Rikenella sp. TaxID=368003 RepID=UPI0025DD84A6|nr:hypothetical protein [uncultured Rikenella sp.]
MTILPVLRSITLAPGFRHYTSGTLDYVGNGGYSWLSTSYDSGDHYHGMYLGFTATEFGPNNADLRACGLQLRCLSE